MTYARMSKREFKASDLSAVELVTHAAQPFAANRATATPAPATATRCFDTQSALGCGGFPGL